MARKIVTITMRMMTMTMPENDRTEGSPTTGWTNEWIALSNQKNHFHISFALIWFIYVIYFICFSTSFTFSLWVFACFWLFFAFRFSLAQFSNIFFPSVRTLFAWSPCILRGFRLERARSFFFVRLFLLINFNENQIFSQNVSYFVGLSSDSFVNMHLII